MAKNKQRAAKGQRSGTIQKSLYMFLPLMAVLGVIPLVMQLELIQLPAEVQPFWKENYATDFFSYYKFKFLCIAAVAMLAIFGYYKLQGLKEPALQDRKIRCYLGAVAVFAVMEILAAILSDFPWVALRGAPERCEGIFTLLIYLVILLYGFWVYSHKAEFGYIGLSLGFLIAVTAILGAFQFWGHDPFLTEWGQKLIVPEVYRSQGQLTLLREQGVIYGTMYHYNFVGSFAAMMVPLFAVLALFWPQRRQQMGCAVLTLLALFILLGSTSRAGLVGVVLATLCFFLIFGRKLVQHYKVTLGCVAALLVFVLGVNAVTGGLALARVPSLLHDMAAVVSSSEVDYHDQIPVRQIDLQQKQAVFTFQDGAVTIAKNANGQPVLTATDGTVVTAPAEDGSLKVGQHAMELQYLELESGRTPFLGIYVGEKIEFILGLYDEGFALVDSRLNKIDYVEAPSIGFAGKEKLGSSRGYIWSRSLPLLLDHWLIGSGPDTFFAVFPQGDLLAKLYAYDGGQYVDKPHNLYLQIGIQEGGVALLAFLVLLGVYLADSFRLYGLRQQYNRQQIIGAAVALAVIGYLGAGVFNDSVVSVAPIFWALLGVGIAANYRNGQQQKEERRLEKANGQH